VSTVNGSCATAMEKRSDSTESCSSEESACGWAWRLPDIHAGSSGFSVIHGETGRLGNQARLFSPVRPTSGPQNTNDDPIIDFARRGI
jgi:hypothetical protein